MKNPKFIAVQSAVAIPVLLGIALPFSPAYAQEVPGELARAAEQACTESAQSKGFALKEVVSIDPKGTDGANVVLNLTKDGQLYKLTCGYSEAGGAIFGEDAAGITATAPDTTFAWWWVLLPLIGLPLLLWWARGRDAAIGERKTYLGRSETIVRSDGLTVNIHSAPEADARVTGTLQDGQPVTLSGSYKGNWAELADGGWVSSEYLEANQRYISRR